MGAQQCLKQNIDTFAVATVSEAVQLRQYDGLKVEDNIRIIVLGAAVPDEYELFAAYKLDLMLSGPEALENFLSWAKMRGDKEKTIDVQCMVDTGMTRIGFQVD